ncbi:MULTISPECIES: response regulator transcription factor [unclassified Luteimonas]
MEDDPEYRDAILAPTLERSEFEVTAMGSALELYRALASRSFDLVLLDVGLPDDCGYAIARHLREVAPTMGIVMLTGHVAPADRVRGLEAGADTYLGKPVGMPELVAVLRNLATRVAATRTLGDVPAMPGREANDEATAEDTSGRWRLDADGWRILAAGKGEVELNMAERQVLLALAAAPGVPVSRKALMGQLTVDAHDFDSHRLETLVYRLRRKCLQQAGVELPLRAVRGLGYALVW